MNFTKLDEFKIFALRHRKMVVFSFCLIICLTLLYVFTDSYASRYDNEFTELNSYLLKVKVKDMDIRNRIKVKEVVREGKGIDISSWQREINWEAVKNSGIDYVMIRCGYRNLTNSEIHVDPRFENNIKEANRLGIPVGVYFYSTARNQKEAMEEATFVLNLIKDYEITYPVAYDFELYNQKRMEGIGAGIINENALLFLDHITSHGYNGMIYSNLLYLNKVWDIEKFEDYKFWLAQYDGKYETEYDFLQYSDKGHIDGIETNVDMNKSKIVYERVE